VSKAFTKDDGPSLPEVRRHRPPLPQGSLNYVTTAGLEALRQELAQLEHESGGQSAAWRAELEERIASAVVPAPPNDRTEIRFGALVRLRGQDTGDRELRIVGVDEADPAAGLVAFVAPIARALLGRRLGDVVTVRTPGGMEEMEVLAVDYGAR
jgi:transcription elongation factor GreB